LLCATSDNSLRQFKMKSMHNIRNKALHLPSIQNKYYHWKLYKKLSIQVSGVFVFCLFEMVTSFNELHFDRFHKDIKIEDLFSSAFQNIRNANYDEVLIIHNNNLDLSTWWEVTCNIILKSLKLIFLLLIH
jgi:hypothetical protein